jgi:hypothetical protein
MFLNRVLPAPRKRHSPANKGHPGQSACCHGIPLCIVRWDYHGSLDRCALTTFPKRHLDQCNGRAQNGGAAAKGTDITCSFRTWVSQGSLKIQDTRLHLSLLGKGFGFGVAVIEDGLSAANGSVLILINILHHHLLTGLGLGI